MDCFYDSEEEVAWGPLTLREIKKEILEHSRKLKRRETDFGQCTFYTPSASLNDDKIPEVNATGSSAYFTPDESLAPEEHPNRHESFLEKMNQVIEDDSENVGSSKIKDDTLYNILKSGEGRDCILENIQQSLIDNTVVDKEKITEVVSLDSTIEEVTDEDSYDESDNKIITISDESTSDNIEPSYESPKLLIKTEEKDTSYEDEINISSLGPLLSERLCFESDKNCESTSRTEDLIKIDEKHTSLSYEDEINISGLGPLLSERLSFQSHENDESTSRTEDLIKTDEKHTSLSYEDEINVSGLGPLLSERLSSQSESTSRTESPVFNDTMEEMEMALKQGLNYVMPGDSIIPNTPVILKTTTNTLQIHPVKNKLPKTPKFDYIKSPVGDYIKKKSPNNDNFKLPTKIVKKKPQTPNPKSPLVTTKFKDIVSPIGMYIKNSPRVCIKQNVVAKTVPSLKSPANVETVKCNKENYCEFPEVVYKPGKKIVTSSTKEITLPSSIKKMVPEATVTTHTMKIQRNKDINKLLNEDVNLTTIDNSLLNQTGENVSFVKSGKAFIK